MATGGEPNHIEAVVQSADPKNAASSSTASEENQKPKTDTTEPNQSKLCQLFLCLRQCCHRTFYLRSGGTTLGMLYFIFLLSGGVVISISAAIQKPQGINEEYINYFFVFCMVPGIVWMIGACSCPTPALGCCLTTREPGSQIPCYIMFGLALFCLGSSFISLVDFLGFAYSLSCDKSSTTEINKRVVTSEGISDLAKLFFTIFQLQFLCRFSNVSFKKRYLTSFFILHIIAVNLTTWFNLIVNESVIGPPYNHTIYTSNCSSLETITSFAESADSYLYPFSIEYAVISSVLLFLMWYELWDKGRLKTTAESNKTRSKKCCSRLRNCCCREVGQFEGIEDDPKTMWFWKSSPFGYAFGILLLVGQLVLLVISQLEYKHEGSAEAYHLVRIVMFLVMTGLLIWGTHCLPRHKPNPDTKFHSKIDSVLIMLGVSGCYLMTFFNIISVVSDIHSCKAANTSHSKHNNSSSAPMEMTVTCEPIILGLFTTDNVVALVQLTFQVIFITQALRRRKEEISLQSSWPRRVICNVSALMSFANIGVWCMDTFELKDAKTVSSIDALAYGKVPWAILSHVAFPLCIFFRLHSAFCFFEININRFGDSGDRKKRLKNGYRPVPQKDRPESRETQSCPEIK